MSTLIESEIADFFAGFGGPGDLDIQSGEAQRLLTERVLLALRKEREAAAPAINVIFKDGWPIPETVGVFAGSEKLPDGAHDFYAAPPAPPVAVPETLPCPVLLEPGLRFGKGVNTQIMLDALHRRAEYYAELEAMTPEQRAEHEAGIKEFAAMLAAPGKEVAETDNTSPQYESLGKK